MLFDTGCAACDGGRGPVCGACAEALSPHSGQLAIAGLDACRIRYRLDDRLRSLIVALKYRRQRRLASWLAQSAVDLVPRAADALCWVPATPERRQTRGFDQAQELATVWARITDVPAQRLLVRRTGDERQTGQDRVDRLAGPALAAARSSPAFVVVVDDVVTTGSSLRTAAQILRAAGAERVVGLALAATPHRGQRQAPPAKIWV